MGGGTKNKTSVFTIRETFVLSSICKKCQGSEYPPPPTLNFGTYLPPLKGTQKPVLIVRFKDFWY